MKFIPCIFGLLCFSNTLVAQTNVDFSEDSLISRALNCSIRRIDNELSFREGAAAKKPRACLRNELLIDVIYVVFRG